MRLLFAFLSMLLLTAAAPTRDWSAVVTRLPSGTMLIGNPAAPVKLVEYGSYTCSHCADFSTQSEKVLKGEMIRSGMLSLEYRHLIRDRLDLAAALLARCGGTAAFAGNSAAIFATQSTWFDAINDWIPKHPEADSLPQAAQLKALADGSGLTQLMMKRGLTRARADACLADSKETDIVTAMTGDAPIEVRGTPTLYLNGAIVPGVDWERLQPILAARIRAAK